MLTPDLPGTYSQQEQVQRLHPLPAHPLCAGLELGRRLHARARGGGDGRRVRRMLGPVGHGLRAPFLVGVC